MKMAAAPAVSDNERLLNCRERWKTIKRVKEESVTTSSDDDDDDDDDNDGGGGSDGDGGDG